MKPYEAARNAANEFMLGKERQWTTGGVRGEAGEDKERLTLLFLLMSMQDSKQQEVISVTGNVKRCSASLDRVRMFLRLQKRAPCDYLDGGPKGNCAQNY